jgi:hypothetical protein
MKPKPATKEEIENLFVKQRYKDRPRETYTDNYTMDCPACNAPAEGEGVFFSDSGELIKNNFVQCTKCDWHQAS